VTITLDGAMRFGQGMVAGPRCRVIWGPFESSTWVMARSGWEFAIPSDPMSWGERVRVIAHDRESGLTLYLLGSRSEMESAALGRSYGSHDPTLVADSIHHDTKVLYTTDNLAKFKRVDVIPEYIDYGPIMHKTLHSTFIFNPWGKGAQEIIVDPKTVEDLLAEIKSMQQPELAEIRRRNRSREQASTDQMVAQVIAFAA